MIRATALPEVSPPGILTDPDVLQSVREDASRVPGGCATGLVRPSGPAQVAAALREAFQQHVPVLAVGAQSSLTGGAVPRTDRVMSLTRLDSIGAVEVVDGSAGRARIWVGAGTLLESLQTSVTQAGWYYPPVPTYTLATLGGTVSTNASGSATFKYGSTRDWVEAVRVVTVDGWLLEVHRGQCVAPAGGTFDIVGPDGTRRQIPVPTYGQPSVKKCSLGYHSAAELDLVDLFVGSEGTLGVVVEAQVGLVRKPGAVLGVLVFCSDEDRALELVRHLRDDAMETRAGGGRHGLDVRAIEHMDAASLALVRQRPGVKLPVTIPARTRVALFMEVELPPGTDDEDVLSPLERALDDPGAAPQGPAGRLFWRVAQAGALDTLELALPGDARRARAFREVREAVPLAVNETLRDRQVEVDPGIHKLGGDMCVPFEAWPQLDEAHRRELGGRGLEFVVFGHISDGNVHPNILARSAREMEVGKEALLALADAVGRLGGSPLAEHGVGKNSTKQLMLARYRGPEGMAQMRAIKRAFDPVSLLGRGVLFAPV